MKLKKLSATFDDREHGEKARPLGPEVKKRDVTAARDDYSSYLLSNQQANAQQLDEEDPVTTTDPPPPPPPPPTTQPPPLQSRLNSLSLTGKLSMRLRTPSLFRVVTWIRLVMER